MPKIEIYTKFACPYCARALSLFKSKNVTVEETDVTMGGSDKALMVERSGGRMTMPQIFINGAHIGGCDDLMALEAAGKLDPLLAA